MVTLIFHMRQFESHFSSEHCVAAFTQVWFYFSSLMRTFLIKICTWMSTGMDGVPGIQFYIEIYRQ